MAFTLLLPLPLPLPLSALPPPPKPLSLRPILSLSTPKRCLSLNAAPLPSLTELETTLSDLFQTSPPTWKSALGSNAIIFLLGSPILRTGLSVSGIGAAFVLGSLTWRAFGPSGFVLVASYFVMGTAVTKVKIAQKEAMGIAEKRSGRRGPGSVIGSGAAGSLCALMSILGFGGDVLSPLWKLGFVASFCTKLSDTASSEIGKAYGKTAYLVTNMKVVPRGTEGAVSLEGTIAGFFASVFLASVAYFLNEVDIEQVVICVIASQIANFGESLIGAALQDKEGFQWLNNDVVNVINISTGSILAILMQQILIHSWQF
ncbi:hypothetical protein LUZ60_000502 [Juncus effusus]|nr:hypothetical protein LUZ60_000502 [Juncus effusus]